MAKKRIGSGELDLKSKVMKKLSKMHRKNIMRSDDDNLMDSDIVIKNKATILLRTTDSILPSRDEDPLYKGYDF